MSALKIQEIRQVCENATQKRFTAWQGVNGAGTAELRTEDILAVLASHDALVKLIIDAQAILAAHLPPDGPSEHDTISALLGLLDGPQSRAVLNAAEA